MMIRHVLAALTAALVSAGCASLPTDSRPDIDAAPEPAASSAEQLAAEQRWQEAATLREKEALAATDPAQQHRGLFSAGQWYARAGSDDDVLRIIDRLEPVLTQPVDRWHLRLLQAQWYLLRGEPLLAQARISVAPPSALPAPIALYSAETRAAALIQLQDGVSAVQALIDAGPVVTESAEHQADWLALMTDVLRNRDVFWLTPPDGVNSWQLGGWLALGEMARRLWNDLPAFDAQLAQWARRYGNHPGERITAQLRADVTRILSTAPRTVALLLPLSGNLQAVGEAIRDGFIAAYMDRGEGRLQVHVLDVEALGAAAAVDEAMIRRADVLIGPLRKDRVADVVAANAFGLPQLALNSVETPAGVAPGMSRVWLLSLALPPEDDAMAAARLAMQQGHARVIALQGRDSWAERSVDAFSDSLASQNGALLDRAVFDSRSDSYPEAIKGLLQLERSTDRAGRIQNALGQKVHFDLQRRQDADALYLAADVADARQIRPQIRFYQGADLPVYASGRLFDGNRSRRERDLDDVHFCSSPWLLGSSEGWSAERSVFAALRPEANQRLARFHAVGIDAYQLVTRLRDGRWPQGLAISGASGELTIRDEQVLRRLPCAVFRDGFPQVLGTP
ncbi:MAG: penicillin-binding protein activator [Oceanococcaceae bacterium]